MPDTNTPSGWFTFVDEQHRPLPTPAGPDKAPTTTPVVESAPVTAKPREVKPEPQPAPMPTAQETAQSQPGEIVREHQPWKLPLPSSITPEYIDAATAAGMLGVSELEVIARSDFAGGTLQSIDTGVGKFYDRADVLRFLRDEADGVLKPTPAQEALASNTLYL